MEMPTPCPNCGDIVEFDDMISHPNEFKTLVCEDCHERIEEENNCGNMTDNFGNVIAWKADPDDGLIEFSVNGEELATWSYEEDAEDVFHSFMEIWNKAQESSQGATIDQQARITALEQKIKSQLVCDGLPTFYISDEGMVCTHRLSESDTPVWCCTGDDGLKAMSAIRPTRNIGQELYGDLVNLQALNNSVDGSTEVHDAIAALISKIDMPIATEPSGSTEQLNIEKAKAVFNFINLMIGALESGFFDNGSLTLAVAHQIARRHIKDNYDIDHPTIVEEWGQDVAELCGIKQQN